MANRIAVGQGHSDSTGVECLPTPLYSPAGQFVGVQCQNVATFPAFKFNAPILMSKYIQFVAGEVTNLAVGYLAGLSASMLVSEFFVRKKVGNLWGLAAKREAVSKDDYGWLMFVASYVIGLGVMVSVNYLMRRMRKPETRTTDRPIDR